MYHRTSSPQKWKKTHNGIHCYFLWPYITLSIVTSARLAPVSLRSGFHRNPLLLLCPQPPPRPLQTLCLRDSHSCLAPGKELREQLGGSLSIPQRLCRSRRVQVGGCPGLPQGAPSSGGCTGRCFGASAPQPGGTCQSCAKCLSSLSLGKINAPCFISQPF